MAATPTYRTLVQCRREGWLVGTVERYQYSFRYLSLVKAARTLNAKGIREAVDKLKGRPGGVRKDLFGFLDVLAMTGDDILGIQSTSRSNMRARFNKMITERLEEVRTCLSSGCRIEVWGWKHYEEKVNRLNWRHSMVVFGMSHGLVTATFPTGKVLTELEF